MRPQPLAPTTADASELQCQAWRRLLATVEGRNAARVHDPERAEALDDDGPPWLAWQSDGLTVTAVAPPAVRPLLDLYAPLCAAGPGRPLTVAHLGQSLDGYIATGSGDSYYVTGPDNLCHLHRLRALSDAVIVGAGTVARDDPQLTVRHVEGTNPLRVVLDPRGRLAPSHRVFTDGQAETLIVHGDGAHTQAPPGAATVLTVPLDDGRLRLGDLLDQLHARGLWSVFIEGGGTTVSSFLEANLLDRLHLTIAPLITGSGRPGVSLPARDKIADCLRPRHRVFAMGGDVLFDCDLRSTATAVTAASGELTRAW